ADRLHVNFNHRPLYLITRLDIREQFLRILACCGIQRHVPSGSLQPTKSVTPGTQDPLRGRKRWGPASNAPNSRLDIAHDDCPCSNRGPSNRVEALATFVLYREGLVDVPHALEVLATNGLAFVTNLFGVAKS